MRQCLLVFDDLILIDRDSDAYADFTLFAWDSLLNHVTPMPDDVFWPHFESVGWPKGSEDIAGLSERFANRVSLVDATRIALAALDWTGDLEFLWDTEIDVSGEDSQEDFLYHLVGLGQSFVQSLQAAPSPAVTIADNDSYVESFRYVLDGCHCHFPFSEYVDTFVTNKRFARSHAEPVAGTMRKVDDRTPGVVIRVDDTSYEIITPIETHTIEYP